MYPESAAEPLRTSRGLIPERRSAAEATLHDVVLAHQSGKQFEGEVAVSWQASQAIKRKQAEQDVAAAMEKLGERVVIVHLREEESGIVCQRRRHGDFAGYVCLRESPFLSATLPEAALKSAMKNIANLLVKLPAKIP